MEIGSPCVTPYLIIRIWQSSAGRRTKSCALCQYQLSANINPDNQQCLTVQSIVRQERSLNKFMASIRVKLSVSSPTSSYFTIGSRAFSYGIIPSAPPLSCVGRSSSSSISDALASSPPSVSSGIVTSALPCCILSLLRSR